MLTKLRNVLTRSSAVWSRSCHSEAPHTRTKESFGNNKVSLSCGQPTTYSHPHLLQDDELQPGIQLNEFRSRRQHLMEEIWQRHPSDDNHLIVIPSATQVYMTEKIPYPYRQSTDMLYLTGCTEPGSALVLTSSSAGRMKELLFVRGKDPRQELWDGPRLAANQTSASLFGVDETLPASELASYLRSFANNREKFTLWYENSDIGPTPGSIRSTIDKFLVGQKSLKQASPRNLLHALRVIKSAGEAKLMARAGQIGSEAVASTIAIESGCRGNAPPWLEESQIAARVDLECRSRGAQQLAYPPVVASGPRANIIHYVSNNQRAAPDDLILMDAGCEYFGYNSDITRTWPVSGKFTSAQRTLYEALLDVQIQLISLLEEKPSLDQLFAAMCQLIGLRLRDLCFVPSSASIGEMTRAAHMFCPHHVSHFLGMDVHDTNTVPHNLALRSGMVLTIEPGIYISPENTIAPKEFRGLGMRIEDDVLITDSGPLVLSSHCPKRVTELEELMASRPCHWP